METVEMNTRLTQAERETHIVYDPATKKWIMDTSISTHWNKALKQGWQVEKQYMYEGYIQEMVLSCVGNAISIRNTSTKTKRTMTDEQKRAASERLRNMRKSK